MEEVCHGVLHEAATVALEQLGLITDGDSIELAEGFRRVFERATSLSRATLVRGVQ